VVAGRRRAGPLTAEAEESRLAVAGGRGSGADEVAAASPQAARGGIRVAACSALPTISSRVGDGVEVSDAPVIDRRWRTRAVAVRTTPEASMVQGAPRRLRGRAEAPSCPAARPAPRWRAARCSTSGRDRGASTGPGLAGCRWRFRLISPVCCSTSAANVRLGRAEPTWCNSAHMGSARSQQAVMGIRIPRRVFRASLSTRRGARKGAPPTWVAQCTRELAGTAGRWPHFVGNISRAPSLPGAGAAIVVVMDGSTAIIALKLPRGDLPGRNAGARNRESAMSCGAAGSAACAEGPFGAVRSVTRFGPELQGGAYHAWAAFFRSALSPHAASGRPRGIRSGDRGRRPGVQEDVFGKTRAALIEAEPPARKAPAET